MTPRQKELTFYEMGNYERRTRLVDSDEEVKSCSFDMLEKSIRCLSRYIKQAV